MSASLVGSEMCIRDRLIPPPSSRPGHICRCRFRSVRFGAIRGPAGRCLDLACIRAVAGGGCSSPLAT
eukprot:328048-Alexandrium_andersonii.AAC.1